MAGLDDLEEEPAARPAPPPPPRAASEAPVVAAASAGPDPDDDLDREPLTIEIIREQERLSADTLFGDIDLSPTGTTGVSAQVGELFATGAVSAADHERAQTLVREAGRLGDQGRWSEARDRLAAALQLDPRNRTYRGLYHAASGYVLVGNRNPVEATTQFETALVHDPGCETAQVALDRLRRGELSRGLPRGGSR
jgi:hypothetical protein